MNKDITAYNQKQKVPYKAICVKLAKELQVGLKNSESKVWHGSPVWFLEGNPVVSFAVRKIGVQLLFFSGQSFKEKGLLPEGSFKAAEARFLNVKEINSKDLKRWLKKAKTIQWDYKNIVKRRGKLVRLK
jgi:hypothetical protein